MKPRRFLSYASGLGAAVMSIFSPGCKDNPVIPPTPENQVPIVDFFRESPATIVQGKTAGYAFKAHDPDGTLDSLVLVQSDGTRQKWTPHSAAYQDSTSLVCNTPGPNSAKFTAYDNSGGKAEMQADFTVTGNGSPVLNTSVVVSGVENAQTAFPLSSLEKDPESDPLTNQIIGKSAGLEARINSTGDSVIVGMTNPDGNGAGSFTMQVSDGHNPPVTGVFSVAIAAMDQLGGNIHDALKESYIVLVDSKLELTGQVGGYFKADGNNVNVNSDGSFLLPGKIPSKAHAIEYFIYKLGGPDSSFVVRDTIPAGDNTSLDLAVHTNAGTGPTPSDPPLPLGLLKAYYDDMGLHFFALGVNLKEKANQRTIYLSAKDTNDVLSSGPVKGLTSAMQDTIANRLQNGIFVYLPPQNRPNLVKGSPSDALPLRNVNGITTPLEGYGIGFRQDNQIGFYIGPLSPDGENKSCVVLLSYTPLGGPYPGGFQPAATMQEWLTWLCAPGGGTSNPALKYKTCMYEGEATAFLTGADQKALTMLVLYTPKTPIAKFLNLP